MANIFISYSRKNGEEFAKYIWSILNQTGYTPFMDQQNIPIGAEWMKKIDEEINNSSKFILILTDDVFDSEHVKYEFSKATILKKDGKISILPFKIETLDAVRIPEEMRKLQCANFGTKEGLAREVLIYVYPEETLIGKPIEEDIRKVQIERIFVNRKPDPKDMNIFNDLSKQLERQIVDTTEVFMLGNSFRDFFGEDTNGWKVIHRNIIENARKNNVQFKVLLLDPTSEAAKERAKIEEGPDLEDDIKYLQSVLFKDIKEVTNWLNNLNSPQIEVRYSTLTPTAFIIRTDNYTFFEQYHLGHLKWIQNKIREEDKRSLCLGGYVPFFMIKNTSDFAKLLRSHFDHIWDTMKDNKLEKIAGEIIEFENNSMNYRRKQFIEIVNQNVENLRSNPKKYV